MAEQHEGQGQRRLQQAGLTLARAQRSTATMGAAASATCSADCAARLDQASRLKVGGSRSSLDRAMANSGFLTLERT